VNSGVKNHLIHLGIIDFLQTWDFNKKVEALYKKNVLRKKGDMISAVEPIKYRQRFLRFLRMQVFSRDASDHISFEVTYYS
jgi:hypothetical protein